MEWVQTTGKTVDDAVSQALDELGVASEDAEVEVLEEPRQGLFGRVRGTARVRARVRPTAPRPKQERRRRGGRKDREPDGANEKAGGERAPKEPRDRSGSGRGPARATKGSRGSEEPTSNREDRERRDTSSAGQRSAAPSSRVEDKEREMMPEAEQRQSGEAFLTGLLDSMDLDGSVTSSLDDAGILRFDVAGSGLGLLIGPGLVTLDAVQEICRNAIQRQAAGREYGKVELDVAGARAERKRALEEFTRDEATRVLDTGDEVIFDVMSRSDRKIVHDVISEFDGLQTESVGEDPRRRVILRRA